ncbi:MAG TPA: hypothetical protein VFE18_15340 [Phenylobacterium sp.]|jgi:hypothetical protein|uniref:hypothetical protein n=1 Tax=Phenylobacterium sp. TaxID=1871053 RepID=UPI002D3C9B27|nr:hypothetical protein [Phenylobacterium sp.]HZZ69546.1 hypothetical protein [Phenylobacterium sp.]
MRRLLAALSLAVPLALGGAARAQSIPSMAGMDMKGMDMPGMDMSQPMTGAYGPYAMNREASGTSWQPDASPHEGLHLMVGPWSVMFHGDLYGVYDQQNGPRGAEKDFVSGMFMGMAQRPVGDVGTLQLRAMLSPDPLMGPTGYPLLLATGETANGKTPLVDRQHPHDLFMELSASYSVKLSANDSVFVYAGLPGEPAFGPPAFMHRLSIEDSPEAPISHHWLDSTHISFGVLTGGLVRGDWKIEASAYNGREPDQHRYDIETGALDSTAVRLSWNPARTLSLQVSWADEISPEQLEPGVDQHKVSASAIYTVPFGDHGWWASTAAWGVRSSQGVDLDAWVLESALKPNARWTIFSRAERVDNDELIAALAGLGAGHGPVFTVGKISVGAIRDWPVGNHLSFGLGGLYAVNFVPGGLAAAYGDDDPTGFMAFVRLKLH